METKLIENLFGEKIDAYLPDGHICHTILRDPAFGFERPVKEFIQKWVIPGMGFIDVGAHAGLFSLYAMNLMQPVGSILGFEPSPDLAKLCRENLSWQGKQVSWHIVEAAAWNTEDRLKIAYNRGDNEGDNRVTNMPDESSDGWEFTTCIGTAVDTVVKRVWSGLRTSVFLKIDAQWAEVEVLEGSKYTLDHCIAGVVEIQNETRSTVVHILEKAGFLITDLGPDIGFYRRGMAEVS